MPELPPDIKKLASIATNMEYPSNLRSEAIQSIGRMGSHEALLALLEMAGNEGMTKQDRELAVKHATKIIKSGH